PAFLRAPGRKDLPLRGRRGIPLLPDRSVRLRARAARAIGADVLPALRPLPVVLRLPPAPRVVLVDRHFRAEHGHGQPLPAARRVPALLPDLPAPPAPALRQARRVDGRAAGALEGPAAGLSLGEPRPPVPALRDSSVRLPLRRLPADPGREADGAFGRAAVVVDPPRRLPGSGTPGPGALRLHAGRSA